MEIIDSIRNDWFSAYLIARLDAMADQEAASRISAITQEFGSEAVLKILDATDGFETPEPPKDLVVSRGMQIFFSGLSRS